VQSLFLALVLYPEVQKKAQAEIDAVIGSILTIVLLCHMLTPLSRMMRWHLVGPVGELSYHHGYLPPNWFEGLPHMATNDHESDGY
jgi:hypothetical protein